MGQAQKLKADETAARFPFHQALIRPSPTITITLRKTSLEHQVLSRPIPPSDQVRKLSRVPEGQGWVLGQQHSGTWGRDRDWPRAGGVSGLDGPCLRSPDAVLGRSPRDTRSRRRGARPQRYASRLGSPTSGPEMPTCPWPSGSACSFKRAPVPHQHSPLKASRQCHSYIRPSREPLHRHPPPSHPLRAAGSVTQTLFPMPTPLRCCLVSAGRGLSRLPHFRPEED